MKSISFFTKRDLDTIWDQNSIFYFLCIEWFTGAFWIIDQNLNVRSKVLKDLKVRIYSYMNKARVPCLFTNSVKLRITVSLTKWLIVNKINWLNVFTNNIINRIKTYLMEIYSIKHICEQLQNSCFV